MSRSEVLSPEGLRLDGRRPGEIRRLRCQLSAEPKADGSAYLEQGNTKVLVTVCGPHEVSSQRKAQHDRAVLHCTYSALPFSAGQHKSHPSRTADSELASSVRSLFDPNPYPNPYPWLDPYPSPNPNQVRAVFDPVVQTQLYPRTQIDVSITLLQADGGVRAACINATTLALIDAGIAMEDFVCACTAGKSLTLTLTLTLTLAFTLTLTLALALSLLLLLPLTRRGAERAAPRHERAGGHGGRRAHRGLPAALRACGPPAARVEGAYCERRP